jgi:hypothetical protein
MIDELTFEFTPAQSAAIRAYVARCEREFLQSLREDVRQGAQVRGEARALSEFDSLALIPSPPRPPPMRLIREGDFRPPCPRCGSSQKRTWLGFGRANWTCCG